MREEMMNFKEKTVNQIQVSYAHKMRTMQFIMLDFFISLIR